MDTKVAYEYPKEIAASRANGAKSLGPVSLQGKIASSRNSTHHGLFAENVVLEAEDTGRFLELVEASLRNTTLAHPTQKLLVENIATARWRQWRIWGMQKVALDDEVASLSITNDPPCAQSWLGETPPTAFAPTNSSGRWGRPACFCFQKEVNSQTRTRRTNRSSPLYRSCQG